MPSLVPQGHSRGLLIAIGGAEDKKRDRHILSYFCRVSGGTGAHIAIIPTASQLPEIGDIYAGIFAELCGARTTVLPIHRRSEAMDPEVAKTLDQATGIFLTGGNQLKLVNILGGTPLAQIIRRANARGVPIAGTSAGASAISGHMIETGYGGSVPRYGMVRFAPGLGLNNRVVIDQHFTARRRLGRLITAVGTNPFLIGLGIDEDTAVVIDHEGDVDIIGSGSVTIVDGSEIEHTNLHQLRSHQPAAIVGVRLHVLTEGWRYSLQTREVIPSPEPAGVDDVVEPDDLD